MFHIYSIAMFMFPLLVAASAVNSTKCGDFHANFDLRKVIGSWYVVAIVPVKMFPEHQDQITYCHRVEFSDTDVAGLRWLVNRTYHKPTRKDISQIKGTIVRQRYHSVPPFDVWSKSVEGDSGCFQQVLSLDTHKSDLNKVLLHKAMMQLHIQETTDDDNNGPFLVQILWGKMISAVIYRRNQEVTSEQLKPILDLITKLKGPQLKPKICVRFLQDILGLRN